MQAGASDHRLATVEEALAVVRMVQVVEALVLARSVRLRVGADPTQNPTDAQAGSPNRRLLRPRTTVLAPFGRRGCRTVHSELNRALVRKPCNLPCLHTAFIPHSRVASRGGT